MIHITDSAIRQLQIIMLEHPEDPIVRVKVRDLDDRKLNFSITLEDGIQPDDEIQEMNGLIVAVEGQSVDRMDGMTIDFQEPEGFKFIHPEPQEGPNLDLFHLN